MCSHLSGSLRAASTPPGTPRQGGCSQPQPLGPIQRAEMHPAAPTSVTLEKKGQSPPPRFSNPTTASLSQAAPQSNSTAPSLYLTTPLEGSESLSVPLYEAKAAVWERSALGWAGQVMRGPGMGFGLSWPPPAARGAGAGASRDPTVARSPTSPEHVFRVPDLHRCGPRAAGRRARTPGSRLTLCRLLHP